MMLQYWQKNTKGKNKAKIHKKKKNRTDNKKENGTLTELWNKSLNNNNETNGRDNISLSGWLLCLKF